jgi:type I restriction enzyme, S subunit
MVQMPLSEVADIVRGIAFPKEDKSYVQRPGDVACLRTTNVQRQVEWDDLWFVPERHVKRDDQRVRTGDILISTANSYELVGKVAQVAVLPTPATLGAFISLIRPKNGVHPKFLYHQLAWGQTQTRIRAMSSNTTNISNVSTKKLATLELAVPNFDKQTLIVAELEKQFSRLDEAVANLKRVKANLKRYKASVLKDAVEGRLVPTEAELARRESRSFETGAQLLKRILEARRDQWTRGGLYKTPLNRSNDTPGEIPEGWVWSTYEQLGRMQLGRQRSPKYHNGPNMRPYLRVQNVFEDRIDLSDVMEMDFSASDFEKYELMAGDLLLNEGQSPELLGRPAIYRGELPGACFTNTLIRFRAAEGVSVEFALHLSRHYMLAGRFVDEGTITTNIAHLSLGRLATVEFPLPPFAEQIRIVAEVERRLSLVRGVEVEVDANLKRAQALRRSVLAKSFTSQ